MERFSEPLPGINLATAIQRSSPDPAGSENDSGAPEFLPDLVGLQGMRNPDAVAVVEGDKKLSYGELNRRANQLAHLLRKSGVRAEVPVAVFLERSAELAVAALAIWKAGGAYVPLDPGYPARRISMLLEDSAAPLVLTHSSLVQKIPVGDWRMIVLDTQGAEIAGHPTGRPEIQTEARHLAYVIFTSGSTGRPKGVQITHANLLHLVRWHRQAFKVTSADHATMQTSPGFDAAVWELWPYLAVGASVYVVDEAVRTEPERLRDWMVASGVTISFLPTAMAECMIELSWPAETALRTLLTGADTLHRYPPPGLPFALVNNYGPTEGTVVATSGTIPPHQQPAALPSIGRPIDGAQIYIVDEQFRLAPDGDSGELLIGGEGVGRGYLNLPQLTAEKFLADPFHGADGARLYRTGDRARLLPDGQIEFMGRMDEQIKIMGYRIEPGEVAAVLDRHPAIASSCVTAHSGHTGEKQLVAYVVPEANAGLDAGTLREFLADYLPDYMLPSAFVRIANLPFTSHGKIDRAALPTPSAENMIDGSSFEAPQSEIEQWLAKFLTALLGVGRVSRDDNFFSLGGHSLMGAQLIARVHQSFGVNLSLRSLFDHPTLREISSEIENLVHAKLNAMSDDEARRVLESSSPGMPA